MTNVTNSTGCILLQDTQLLPYWIIVVNTVLLWFLNLAFLKVRARICAKSAQEKGTHYISVLNDDVLFPFDSAFGWLQMVGHVAHFLFIAYSSVQVNKAEAGSWSWYTRTYCGFVNSGATVFLVAALGGPLHHLRSLSYALPRHLKQYPQGVIVLLLMVPAIVTHSLPMAIMYGYVTLGAGLVLVAIALAFGGHCMLGELYCHCGGLPQSKYSDVVWAISIRLAMTMSFVLFVQTGFNYGVLLYDLPFESLSTNDYLAVIVREWHLRDTTCFVSGLANTARQAANFASIF